MQSKEKGMKFFSSNDQKLKMTYAQSGVDVEAGCEVVERIKNTWLVPERAGVMELLVVLVACLTFKNRCQRARFDLRYRWCRY